MGIIAFLPHDGICNFNPGWIPSLFVFCSTAAIVVYGALWLLLIKKFGVSSDAKFFMRKTSSSQWTGYEEVELNERGGEV